MHRLLLAAIVGITISCASGCLVAPYSGDPGRRTRQLINSSEDLRSLYGEWERLWFLDQPSHMKPYRTHGGVI